MKYILSMIAGVIAGAAIGLCALLFNPFAVEGLSPLVVSDRTQLSFGYSAVPADAIVLTNNGDTHVAPIPEKVSRLWEPTIRNTEVLVTELTDSRGSVIGVGVKFSSASEQTSLINGQALVDSVWHLSVPARGTAFIEQTENVWNYLRDVVVPARWSASDSWQGNWHGTMSSGPGALGTARIYGGSGTLRGIDADAIETRHTQAYSAVAGPIMAEGRLVIELPDPTDTFAGNAE